MKAAHLLILLAALTVSSLGIRHWARDAVTASEDANRESSRPVAPVRDASSGAIAPTPNDTAGIAGTPASGIPSSTSVAAPADDASSPLDRSGTPDAPGDPEAQPENPSEQFMHSRRGDGQHQE